MKNIILKSVLVAVILFCGIAVSAQQVTEKKTNPDNSVNKPVDVKMQAPPLPLKITQRKNTSVKNLPMIPGGGFKPMDTRGIGLTELQTKKYYHHIPIMLTQNTAITVSPVVAKPVLKTAASPDQNPKPQLPSDKQQ